jgi:transcriptional regulator with GAF, ATPase, and Fis domain
MTSKLDPNLHVLALAALFDGPFSIDWIQALAPIKASEILRALDEGLKNGLIVQESTGVYSFADPQERRRLGDPFPAEELERLHRQIAEMMPREIADETEMIKAVAGQLLHVTNDHDGCRWLLKAGDLHRKAHQPALALQCYEKIFKDLRPIKDRRTDLLFIDAAISYSKVTASTHEAKPVIAVLHEAQKVAVKANNRIQQSIIEMHLAKNEWLRSSFDVALKHFERGRILARGIDDPGLQRSINVFSTFFPYWHGRFAEAVRNYEQLVPDVERFPQGRFPRLAGATIGVCYGLTGQISQSLGMLHAIHNHSLEIGDATTANVTKQGLGWIFMETGRISEARMQLEEAYSKWGELHGILHEYSQLQFMAYIYFISGNHRKSLSFLREQLRYSNENAIMAMSHPALMEICRAMEEGRYPKVVGLELEKLTSLSLQSKNLWVQGVGYRYKALIQAREARPHREIMRSLQKSVKLLQESGHQMELARTRLELGRHLLRRGQEEEARSAVMAAAETLAPINENLLPDDLRHLIKDFRTGANLLEEILKMGREIVTIRDNKALAQRIISTVNRITGAERGAIFLIDDAAASLHFILRAARNLTPEDIDHPLFARSMELIRQAAQTKRGQILILEKTTDPLPSTSGIIRSCICVPMVLGEKVVGVLYHDNRFLPSVFVESDLNILAYFAAQAAIALDNVKAYQEIQNLNRMLQEEKQYLEEQNLEHLNFEDTIGKSPAFMHTLQLADRVAGVDTTVLILGETGVGKEVIARAIHKNSPRCDRPFIRVNCTSMPESLISSELFGHERGAFTGAVEKRLGRFELADGGTLFLDEIGDIPLDVQVRLLRVLQSKEFERVGGRETLRSDFRLIAATNRDLSREVRANKFRQDLFYRLNVFPIQVPPLRKRKDDIPLLAHYFLKIFTARTGKFIDTIPDYEMDKLVRYDWPGNVRELENVIERGVILSPGQLFRVPELDITPWKHISQDDVLSLEDNERRMILMALEKAGGKVRGKGGAAELLHIHRNTLYSRMNKLGIRKSTKTWPIDER